MPTPRNGQVLLVQLDHLAAGFHEILDIHNIIAVKDGSRFVSGNFHRDFLRDTSPNKIPHRSSPKVMDKGSAIATVQNLFFFWLLPATQANFNTSSLQGYANALELTALEVRDPLTLGMLQLVSLYQDDMALYKSPPIITIRGSPVFVSAPESSIVTVFMRESNLICRHVSVRTSPLRMPVQ